MRGTIIMEARAFWLIQWKRSLEKVPTIDHNNLSQRCFEFLSWNYLASLGSFEGVTTEYPATVGNLFLRIRRSLKMDARLNQEQ